MVAGLTDAQRNILEVYAELLAYFNKRINLISPNTVGSIWSTHIEHCLALTCAGFPSGARVVDWGTGGGLPLIPMAVCFPDVQFIGVDAVGKKIKSIRAMARKLGVSNVDVWHGRAEAWPGSAHYSISRATAPLSKLWAWHARMVTPLDISLGDAASNKGAAQEVDSRELDFSEAVVQGSYWTPGLICLKGGDLRQESGELKSSFPQLKINSFSIATLLSSPLFLDKYILHIGAGASQ